MRFILLLILMLNIIAGHCCINGYRALLNGKIEYQHDVTRVPYPKFEYTDTAYLRRRLHEADSIYKATGSIEDLSDYGAVLVYNGDYVKAKIIFQSIEAAKPKLYATSSNLGTTYELLGQNDSAYYWIKKALSINPASHDSSEWIHLKILEAKIHKANPETILNLDFGTKEKPEYNHNLNIDTLRTQLYFQLTERLSFVKPKEAIVAQLLFDLGNISAQTDDVSTALDIYKMAEMYGYSSAVLEKRKAYFQKLQNRADMRTRGEAVTISDYPVSLKILGFAAILFCAALLVFIIARRKQAKNLPNKKIR